MVAETLHEGTAGRRLRAAKGLAAAGAALAALAGGRSRPAAGAAGACCSPARADPARDLRRRHGVGGDPKYTVVPQRERMAGHRQD